VRSSGSPRINVRYEKAQQHIEKFESGISRLGPELDENPTPKRASELHTCPSGDKFGIGLCKILQGDSGEAQQWLSRGASHELEVYRAYQRYAIEDWDQRHWSSEPIYLLEPFYKALVAEDEELLEDIVSAVSELSSEPEAEHDALYRYYLVKTIDALVRDAPVSEQREYVQGIRSAAAKARPELQEYFTAFATALEGIVECEKPLFRRGIELTLREHDDNVDGEPQGPQQWLDYRSMALLVLARRNGLSVDVESPYLPSGFPQE
jgi:hypothetical protein